MICIALKDLQQALPALADRGLGAKCVRHAQLFFNRPDYDLPSAKPGSWAVAPNAGMLERLGADYEKTALMIFGNAPAFDSIVASIESLDTTMNQLP
jgi:hypothetical protein